MPSNDVFIALSAVGGFLVIWIAVCALAAKAGGWSALADKYAVTVVPSDLKKRRGRSASVGFANYNGCMTVGVSHRGLYMVPMIFFRFAHPPILIPWRDVRVESSKGVFAGGTVLRIGDPKIAVIRVRSSVPEIADYMGDHDAGR